MIHLCPYEGCSYSATGTGHLFRHVRVHTGDKPFAVRRLSPQLRTSYISYATLEPRRPTLTKIVQGWPKL
jgi:hypothetical protein